MNSDITELNLDNVITEIDFTTPSSPIQIEKIQDMTTTKSDGGFSFLPKQPDIHISKQPPSNRVVPIDDIMLLADDNKIKSSSNDIKVSDIRISQPQQPSYYNNSSLNSNLNVTELSDVIPSSSKPTLQQNNGYDKLFNVADIGISSVSNQDNFIPRTDGYNSNVPVSNATSSVPASQSSAFNKFTSGNNNNGTQQQQQPSTTEKSDNVTDSKVFGVAGSGAYDEPRKKTYEEIQQEKQDLLMKLERLAKKGCPLTRQYTMSSNVDDMRNEFNKIKAENDLRNSVKFQKRMMMAFVTGFEVLNSRFDPFDVKLDGWSESVHDSINEYDDIFEELHEKYKDKAKTAPEIRLLLSLGGSAVMYHITQSMLKSSLPNIAENITQNPDFMRQFGNMVSNTVGQSNPGLGNFMNDMFTANERKPPQYNPNEYNKPPTPPRREMRGPSGMDEILNRVGIPTSQASFKQQQRPTMDSRMDSRVESVSNASAQDLDMYGDKMKNIEIPSDKKKKKGGIHLSI